MSVRTPQAYYAARDQLLGQRRRPGALLASVLVVALFIVLVEVGFWAFCALAFAAIFIGVGYLFVRGPADRRVP